MQNLIKSLVAARKNFKAITKDKLNPHYKKHYASLDSVIDATSEALQNQGLVVFQRIAIADNKTVLQTFLYHESGEVLDGGSYPLPDIQDSQKMGAAITYARRYTYCALLSITADEDDDANSVSGDKQQPKNSSTVVNFKAHQKQQIDTKTLTQKGEKIKTLRESFGITKEWVQAWMDAKKIPNLAGIDVDQLIKDMSIETARLMGFDSIPPVYSILDFMSEHLPQGKPESEVIRLWIETCSEINFSQTVN